MKRKFPIWIGKGKHPKMGVLSPVTDMIPQNLEVYLVISFRKCGTNEQTNIVSIRDIQAQESKRAVPLKL